MSEFTNNQGSYKHENSSLKIPIQYFERYGNVTYMAHFEYVLVIDEHGPSLPTFILVFDTNWF